MPQPTIAGEIERYLRTGDADIDARAWPGDFFERAEAPGRRPSRRARPRGASARERALARAGARERRRRPHARQSRADGARPLPARRAGRRARDPREVGRLRHERQHRAASSSTHGWDRSAWDLANLYLLSVGAELLGEEAARIVGHERGDDLLRLAGLLRRGRSVRRLHRPRGRAHLPQLQAAQTIGLRETRHEGVAARHRVPEARDVRVLVRGVRAHARACEDARRSGARSRSSTARSARISDERVDPAEVASIVAEAATARNGWKVILARCAPIARPRSIAQLVRDLNAVTERV